jgi:syntaxin 7
VQVVVSRADEGTDEQLERQALLQQQQQRQAQVMGNVLEYNEALIEERDQGIAEIHRQIGEVNEMFQDLAVLVNDQGQQLLTIDDQITATAERTRDGGAQLVKAERSQRSARNKCLCIWLVAALVLAVVIIVLFT